jgi:uncharacterized protein (TIGR00297 family)
MYEVSIINLVCILLLGVVGTITYYRKSLDLLGSLLMVVMGFIILFSAGFKWLILILIFLILSLIATKSNKQFKKSIGKYDGQRTAKNVISNGIVAFFMAAFGGFYFPFVGGFIGAISTATADTLASEIGILQEPRLVTTFKKVPPGTDGGISILGTAVGVLGAGIIGIAAAAMGIISNPLLTVQIAVISGLIGCFMDSILGAVFEVRGFINNEHVNLLATLTGAIVGIIFTMI